MKTQNNIPYLILDKKWMNDFFNKNSSKIFGEKFKVKIINILHKNTFEFTSKDNKGWWLPAEKDIYREKIGRMGEILFFFNSNNSNFKNDIIK